MAATASQPSPPSSLSFASQASSRDSSRAGPMGTPPPCADRSRARAHEAGTRASMRRARPAVIARPRCSRRHQRLFAPPTAVTSARLQPARQTLTAGGFGRPPSIGDAPSRARIEAARAGSEERSAISRRLASPRSARERDGRFADPLPVVHLAHAPAHSPFSRLAGERSNARSHL